MSWRVVILLALGLCTPAVAEASYSCRWFGHCVYESPAFHIVVVDKATGLPLAEVHGLAEWQQYGYHGRNGPLVVLDAMSEADGVLRFAAWGPISGSSAGLVINTDPGITLFKSGYKPLRLYNLPPKPIHETARRRGFVESGQTFTLERFVGSEDEWVKELQRIWMGVANPIADEQRLQFREAYGRRLDLVLRERERLASPAAQRFFLSLERVHRLLGEI